MEQQQVNHGGTEMGQGIHTNIEDDRRKGNWASKRQNIRVMDTSTDKVPTPRQRRHPAARI